MRLFNRHLGLIPDEELMIQVVEKKKAPFEELYDRYAPGIYNFYLHRLNNKERAQELTQECFLKLWNKAYLFKKEKSFKVWFWTVARNLLNDEFREIYSEPQMEELKDVELDENELDKLLEREKQKLIEEVFYELPEVCRDILSLWLQDLSYDEMKEVTGKSLDSVKSSLKRAKQEFVARWRKYEKGA